MFINIDNDSNEIIKNFDIFEWEQIRKESIEVDYIYSIDQPEKTELVLITEYPNGGKDYKTNVISPEQGHFDIITNNGESFPYPINIPEGISKNEPVPDKINVIYWKRLTDEEINQKKAEQLEAEEKSKSQLEFLDKLPSQINELEDAQNDLILMMAEIVGGTINDN